MKEIGNIVVSELGLERNFKRGSKYLKLLGLSCSFITIYISIHMGSIIKISSFINTEQHIPSQKLYQLYH